MKLVKLFGLVLFVASAVAAGSLSEPQLPGRAVERGEAGSLRGGGCVKAEDYVCGTGARCTGMLQCVKNLGCQGDYNPDGLNCTADPLVCRIFGKLGTCSE